MTIKQYDVLCAALDRLCAASVCLAEGHIKGRAFEGALFVIGDVQDTLENMLEEADEERKNVKFALAQVKAR